MQIELTRDFPKEYSDVKVINARRKRLIDDHLVPDVEITTDNMTVLCVVLKMSDLDAVGGMLHRKMISTFNEVIKTINTCNTHFKIFFNRPRFLYTDDTSFITNDMLRYVADVVVAIADEDGRYTYVSLLKELNNEDDAFFSREIRWGHNMRKLITATFADSFDKLVEITAPPQD